MQDKTTQVAYGLRECAGQRRLVRVLSQLNGPDADFCGERRFEFTFFDDAPLFKVELPRMALRALSVNPLWYNSQAQAPSWGDVNPQLLEVVRITESLELESVPLVRPVVFPDVLATWGKPRFLCERYLGRTLPDLDTPWYMRLVRIPEGETLVTLAQKCDSYPVFIGKDTATLQYGWGVTTVPEEYEELTLGEPAVMLFSSSSGPDNNGLM
jgi:hypothetical protein